jgi:tetratricopeptide (TPR) repeat protein
MPSVEAGNVYVVALAEALSPTPSALSRARALLVRATTLAPSHADAWRWRARVEQMLIDWNTSGRTSEVRGLRASALASAARAVQLAPRSNGALVSLAEAYLGSNDGEKTVSLLLDVARREIDHPGMLRVASMYHRTIGNDTRAYDQIRTAVQHGPQSASLLVELASFARLRGDVTLACHALNAAVQADAELASAYALRALVRAGLGERREGWADAEIATRLGHPEWGERAAAVLDARFADRNNAVQRLGAMGGISATPVNYIAAVLLAEASLAVSVRGAAAKIVTGLACDSPLRPQLLRDLQGMGVVPADVCKPSTRPPARK